MNLPHSCLTPILTLSRDSDIEPDQYKSLLVNLEDKYPGTRMRMCISWLCVLVLLKSCKLLRLFVFEMYGE